MRENRLKDNRNNFKQIANRVSHKIGSQNSSRDIIYEADP